MDASSGEAVAHVAGALREQVQMHKKAGRYHRRAAKDSMEKLRKFCEAHGIKFSVKEKGGG
ncbi:MAG: hypothetical protein PHS14_02900 [Elusimicrobia bacterium]|nr:hypothetical protein [Elusimicrobiota bacterium]